MNKANSDRMCLDGIQHRIMDNQGTLISLVALISSPFLDSSVPSHLRKVLSQLAAILHFLDPLTGTIEETLVEHTWVKR